MQQTKLCVLSAKRKTDALERDLKRAKAALAAAEADHRDAQMPKRALKLDIMDIMARKHDDIEFEQAYRNAWNCIQRKGPMQRYAGGMTREEVLSCVVKWATRAMPYKLTRSELDKMVQRIDDVTMAIWRTGIAADKKPSIQLLKVYEARQARHVRDAPRLALLELLRLAVLPELPKNVFMMIVHKV